MSDVSPAQSPSWAARQPENWAAIGTITLGDAARTVRALPVIVGMVIDRIVPRVEGRMIKDPTRGSMAPKIPDPTDTQAQAREAARNIRISTLELAAAIGYVPESGNRLRLDGRFEQLTDPDNHLCQESARWADEAAEELWGLMTEAQIRAAIHIVRSSGADPAGN